MLGVHPPYSPDPASGITTATGVLKIWPVSKHFEESDEMKISL